MMYKREERQRASFKRSAHCEHKSNRTAATMTQCTVAFYSSQENDVKTQWGGTTSVAETKSGWSWLPITQLGKLLGLNWALGNHSLLKNIVFTMKCRNNATGYVFISGLVINLKEHWHILESAFLSLESYSGGRHLGPALSQVERSTCLSVHLSVLEAKSSRRIPSVVSRAFAKEEARWLSL